MRRTGAMLADRSNMLRRSVALMPGKAVLRILLI